jgi:DNA-binding CsgD family transcriptional regulator
VGLDSQYLQLYRRQYAKLDPRATAFFCYEAGEIVSTSDVIPYDEFLSTRFYVEWAQPQGWVDSAQVILQKSAARYVQLGFLRTQASGLVDDDMRHRIGMIVPHISRAALIAGIINAKIGEATNLADAADALQTAMFLVEATGRILHANAAGYKLLDSAGPLRVIAGRLVASDALSDRMLREVFLASAQGDDAVGNRGVAIHIQANNGETYLAHVLPLTSGERRSDSLAGRATAALFVQKVTELRISPPESLAKTFKLTPSELRVLLAIVAIGGVPKVAASLGITQGTVKTHLKRLFRKTGSSRQADLVKLVAKFSTPLLG